MESKSRRSTVDSQQRKAGPAWRGSLRVWFCTALLALPRGLLPAQDSASGTRIESKPAAAPIEPSAEDPVVRGSIDRALKFLHKKQQPISGAVGNNYEVAVTALTGLAILGAGYPLHQGPPHARETLENALRFLKQSARDDGYLSDAKSRMHGHCYAMLFLTQLYGELPPDEQGEVRDIIQRGLQRIMRSQTVLGGWYYTPENPEGADEASITICALQALRAANGIGFLVPKSTIDRAANYVKKCQSTGDGSFRYSLRGGDQHTSYALTVAAVSTLQAAGDYDAPQISLGLDFARRTLRDFQSEPVKAAEKEFFFYANLYAAQAFYQAGGELWAGWYPAARRYLLKRQVADGGEGDGSWSDDYGAEFGTAVAILILEVPLNYLPIFQR
jgi:hypothetical protein